MSEADSFYIIDTNYNSGRDAYEVSFGFSTKDEEVKGRDLTMRVTVNVPNQKDDEDQAIEIALTRARKFLEEASKAPLVK